MNKAIPIIAAAIVVLALASGCAGNNQKQNSETKSSATYVAQEDKTVKNIDAMAKATGLDVETATEAVSALENRLAQDGESVKRTVFEFSNETKSENESVVNAKAPGQETVYQVYVREGREPVARKAIEAAKETSENWTAGREKDKSSASAVAIENTDLTGQDEYTALNSSKTEFDRDSSVNLERGKPGELIGDAVAARLLDDLNDELALWGKSLSGPLKVEIGKDVEKQGNIETFMVLAYVDLDKPIFRCVYNLETLGHSCELRP